jgi:hypothetical protein
MSNPDAPLVSPDVLEERVFNLSADKFLAVYRLYEKLGRKKVVDNEMQILRKRLRRLRPRRAPDFTRLLCLPFEEFIGDSDQPGAYLIPRKHCRLLGRFVAASLDSQEVENYRQLISQVPHEDVAALLRTGSGFWRKAAQAIRTAEIRHRKKKRGGLRDSLDLIAGCLDAGAQMANLTIGLPRERFRQLDGRARDLVARTIASVPETRLEELRYPMVLLALRLETPPAVIPLLQDQNIDIPDRKRVSLIRMMSRYLEMDLQAEVSVVEEIARHPTEVKSRELLQNLLPSIQKALANRSAGVGSIPAQSVLETASDVVRDKIIHPAPEAISERLHELLQTPSVADGPEGDPDASLARLERMGGIEEELATLSDLMEHADSLGLRHEIRQATDAARSRIDETADSLMQSLDHADVGTDLDECRRNVYGMVRMIELLEGPDKADELRIRCNKVIAGRAAAA